MVKHVAAISCRGALKEVSNWTANTAIRQTREWVQNASSHLPRSRILQETDPQAANQTRLESCTIWSIEVQHRMICWREEKQCWFVDCITCNLRNLLALIFSLPLELFRLTGVNSVVPTALQSLLASLTPESAKHPSKTHRKICETSRNTKKNSPESCLEVRKEVSKLLASPISFHDWRHCKLLNNPQVHCSLTRCLEYSILNFQHFTVKQEWLLRILVKRLWS